MSRILLLLVVAVSLPSIDRPGGPPPVTVTITSYQGGKAVTAFIVARGAVMEIGQRRMTARGDTATTRTPSVVTANVAGGGLDVVGPADGAWITVELTSPGTPTEMVASAPCVRVEFTGGRLQLRGISRSEALAR